MMHCLRRKTTITTHHHHHHHYHHYHHPYISSTPSSASSQCIMNTNTRHHFSASSSLHFHHRHHHSYHTDHHSSMSRHNTHTSTNNNNNNSNISNNNSSSNMNNNNISTFLNSSASSLTSTNNNKNHNKSNNNTNRYRTIVHMTTFYKKTLPSQLVAFSSPRGKQIFREALSQGTMDNFFNLSENFQIQSEPAYCGLGTLTMVLNSLHIDPGRNWKGVWRWFSEDMFDCCTSLETIQRNGLTLDQFWCLCKCNGADSILYRPFLQRHAERRKNKKDVGEILSEVEIEGEEDEDEQRKLQEFRNLVKSATTTTSTRHQSNYYEMSDHDHYDHHHHHAHEEEAEEKHCGSGTCSNSNSCGSSSSSSGSHACGSGDIVNRNTFFIVVNFSRQALDQTGDGHFSVIAGYHEPTDMVLLLETARFKYPSYWVPLRDLWRAMDSVDSTSGQTRGYLVVKAAAENDSLLYTIFLNHKVSWRQFSLLFSTQIVPSIMAHIRLPSSSSNNDSNIGSDDEGEEIWQLDTIEDLLTLIVTKLPVEIENVLLEYSRTLMFESIMCTHHRNDLPGLLNDLRQTPLFPLVQNAFNRAFELRKKQKQQQQQNHEQQQGQQQNDHQNGSSLRMTMDTESSTQCNSREVMQWAANNHHHLHAGEEDQCTIQFRSIFDAPRCHELIVLLLMTCPIDCLSSIVPRHIWTGVHDVYRDSNQSVPSDKLRQEIEKMRKLIQTLCSMKTKPAGNVIATGILSQCSNTKCMNRCHSSTSDEHGVTFMNA